ncbi:hypothetical protein N7925_00110 [Streptomyces sp. CA-278952]|nr:MULTISPECIES: hypothetical protein [unclassified Streptomyces]UZI26665.1 hypothetical protein OH133_00225 [Streptomyces sp. VB1]WDG26843.1 hypothetical protein N7925_00110 [Streptomyces sp. CA-278952]
MATLKTPEGKRYSELERMRRPPTRTTGTAMLTAVMRDLEAKAIDDTLDLFEILMATRLISAAKRSTDKQRLSTLPQLERASRLVARAATVVPSQMIWPEAVVMTCDDQII